MQRGPTFSVASVAAAGSQMVTLLKLALEYDNHHRQDTVSSRSDVSQITSSSWGARVSSVSGLRTLQIKPFFPTNSTSKTQQVAWQQRRRCVLYCHYMTH